MKLNTLGMFAVVGFILLSGCKKEKDTAITPPDSANTGTTSGSLVGKWTFKRLDQKNGEISLDGNLVVTYHSESSSPQGSWDFKSDGTTISSIGYENKLTTITAGVPQEQNQTVPLTTSTGTYVHDSSAKMIAVTSNGETQSYVIKELTPTKLLVTYSILSEQNTPGGVSKTTADAEIEFSK